MNVPEFKAWFAGITATMGPQPTIEQWDLIKKEIQAIGSEPAPKKSHQGPFEAHDKMAKGYPAEVENPFTKTIRDMERANKQKEQGEGIPGFPTGWPSKHDDNWPYDPNKDKHWLSGTDQSTNSGEGGFILYLNPRDLK